MNNWNMTNWKSKKTAEWWVWRDKLYAKDGINTQSEKFIELVAKPYISALEVGSGTGRLINRLSGRRGAIDINPHLLKLIKPEVKTYCLDISKATIPDKYELVFTYQVLQHLDHEQMLEAIKNIKAIATKEILLVEGFVATDDGNMTHPTGSYYHDLSRYLDCYHIGIMAGGKLRVYRSMV